MLQPSSNSLRAAHEIEALRRAGRVAAQCLAGGMKAAHAGAHTADIATAVEAEMERRGAEPIFRGYRQGKHPPYPSVCCVSVNDEVVHGVPGPRTIQTGDLVCIDVGLRLDSWCADNASSVVAGGPSADLPFATANLVRKRHRLVEHTRAVLALCVRTMRPGLRWSAVAVAAESYARRHGFGVITEFVGHAIGRELHEPPKVPCFWTGYAGDDFVLRPGMTLAVEPILTLDPPGAWLPGNPPGPSNRARVRQGEGDSWSVRTATGADACHEEHTILVTETGAEVLTVC